MKFLQLIRMALKSIAANKVRSFLTMLGIIIGISSVIVLIGMGQGTQKQVAAQIQGLGTNLLTVSITGNRVKQITTSDINKLKTEPGIKNIAPTLSQGNVNIKGGDQTATTTLNATTPEYTEIRNINVQSGRFVTQNDLDNRFRVAVVGVDVADELYNSRDVIGNTININGVDFKIVGVLEQKGSSATGSDDDQVIVPLTVAQRLLKTTTIRSFYVEATSSDTVDEASTNLQIFLLRKYNNDTKSFRVFNQTSLLDTANQTNQSMTIMLSGIAGISLLVGGIGIMNIMLVSVMERTREIGIRKAIGAKRKTILAQFLIESVVVSGLGGGIGVLFGFLGGYLLQNFAHMSISISPTVVLLAFGFSATVGIVFGLYPANKASKLSPIEALRFE
ncbi:MAG: ABC transporter permease [Bacillota bacterium]|nr:ABC transporter permease [Bacillota bacterium]